MCHIWAHNIKRISSRELTSRLDRKTHPEMPVKNGRASGKKRKPNYLTAKERKQVKTIAKTVVKSAAETKHRAFLYPKTKTDAIGNNEVRILFGDTAENGLLNTAQGDQSRPQPDGSGAPIDKPGAVREGQSLRILSLMHKFMFSAQGISPSTVVRVILFKYPQTPGLTITEADILNQPTGTGAGQGWPNIICTLNRWNTKGVTFLKDQSFTFANQPTPGALNAEDVAENWGEGPCMIRSFHHHFGKMGARIKYQDSGSEQLPVKYNIGMAITAHANFSTPADQTVLDFELMADMLFKDL